MYGGMEICHVNYLMAPSLKKWNYNTNSLNRLLTLYLPENGTSESNNGTKANPAVTADLFGDWREEIVERSADNQFLNIYTTINPTAYRIYTLMHDLLNTALRLPGRTQLITSHHILHFI